MKKVRDDLRIKLRKKEWECEDRQRERDQHKNNVERLRLKLNRKGVELSEAWNREQEVTDKLGQLQEQVRGRREIALGKCFFCFLLCVCLFACLCVYVCACAGECL